MLPLEKIIEFKQMSVLEHVPQHYDLEVTQSDFSKIYFKIQLFHSVIYFFWNSWNIKMPAALKI